jgi:lantibiotic modifying enzyme
MEVACAAASWIKPESFKADTRIDIFGGLAGAILGLISLPGNVDSRAAITAIQCGDHILNGSQLQTCDKLGSGFACGTTGIAYALGRLYEATGERRFLQSAQELWEAALATRESEKKDWFGLVSGLEFARDSRLKIDETLPSWQGLAASLDVPELTGSAGRLDSLIEAARYTDRAGVLDVARREAGCMIRRAAGEGGYRLHPALPAQAFIPGFFQGAAGIGYELLRLASPEAIPSVFLWN